jgi:hypothetical protein
MPIPPVSADQIRSALLKFDSEFRGKGPWANWEENGAHRYAIDEAQKLYPVKQIISLGTSAPVSSFSGGAEAGFVSEQADLARFGRGVCILPP